MAVVAAQGSGPQAETHIVVTSTDDDYNDGKSKMCSDVPADQCTLRRAITSATKARLSRFGVEAATYAVELHGGNGYCEDWGLTRQLRDAHCAVLHRHLPGAIKNALSDAELVHPSSSSPSQGAGDVRP